MPERAEIVKSGTWLYDDKVPHGVWIVRQNFDFHWDEGFEDEPER